MTTPAPGGLRTRAALLVGDRRVEMTEVELAPLAARTLLVEVRVSGLCGSDMAVYSGHHAYKRPPVVLGHEFAGIVRQVGAGVTAAAPGDLVCAASFAECGRCAACASGEIQRCRAKRNLCHEDRHGAFAGHVVLDEAMVHVLPPGFDASLGALVEPLTIARHALRRSRDVRGRDVVIVGAGSIGLGCLLFARRAGARRVTCVDQGPLKRDQAARLGADAFVDTRAPDADAALAAAAGPDGADLVIVAASFDRAFELALRAARPGGEINVVTYATPGVGIDVNAYLRAEITLTFSYLSAAADFEEVIDALARGEIDPRPMVTHRLRLDDVPAALALKEGRPADVGKILFDCTPAAPASARAPLPPLSTNPSSR